MRVFRCNDIRILVLCVSLYLFARLFVQIVTHMTCPIVATDQIWQETLFPGRIIDRNYALRVVRDELWEMKSQYEAAMCRSAIFPKQVAVRGRHVRNQGSNDKAVFLYIRFSVPSLSLPRSGLF